MRFLSSLILIAAVLFPAVAGSAAVGADSPPRATPAEPRVILVLSGGGARGAAHIGVLQALEELRIPVHGIVGTSMGAVVGALYASGQSPQALERLAVGLDWSALFRDDPARDAFPVRYKQQDGKLLVRAASGVDLEGLRFPQGFLRGHKMKALFTRQTLHVADVERFAELPIPFAAMAADIGTGEPVLLERGDLAGAMFASMAIPALVTPQALDGRLLVDGGVANNLPVDVALAWGADVVIAVDISSPMYAPEQLTSLLTVTDQLTNLLTRSNTEARIALLRPQDVLVTPDLGGFTSVDFARLETVIPAGRAAVLALAPALEHLRQSEPAFAAHIAAQRRSTVTEIPVERVEVVSETRLDPLRLAAQTGLEPGRLRVDRIERATDQLYGLEVFSEVPYRYRDGTLTLAPVRKAWGPNYLRAGFGLEDDFAGRNHYRLGLALTATELNPAGGEWRSEAYIGDRPTIATEFHQPFGIRGQYYARPSLGWRSFSRPLFDGEDRLTDYQIRQTGLGLALGRTFATSTDARLELNTARGSRERLVGAPEPHDTSADSGWAAMRLLHDSLDNIFFPRSGRTLQLGLLRSDTALGASEDYRAWTAEVSQALARGQHSLVLGAEYASVYDGTAPFHEASTLGGFFRLSGLPVDARIGQHLALHRAAYYYRVRESPIVPIYLGATAEAGQVWAARDQIDFAELDVAGSLFVGIDSPIGPLYIGAGLAEGGNRSMYIFLGQPFRR